MFNFEYRDKIIEKILKPLRGRLVSEIKFEEGVETPEEALRYYLNASDAWYRCLKSTYLAREAHKPLERALKLVKNAGVSVKELGAAINQTAFEIDGKSYSYISFKKGRKGWGPLAEVNGVIDELSKIEQTLGDLFDTVPSGTRSREEFWKRSAFSTMFDAHLALTGDPPKYSQAPGGGTISGPSVRFLLAAFRAMPNVPEVEFKEGALKGQIDWMLLRRGYRSSKEIDFLDLVE